MPGPLRVVIATLKFQAAIPEWPAIHKAGAQVMLDLAVMAPGDHAYGARWDPGQHANNEETEFAHWNVLG
ncbi:MAG TPA: hypothetical protein VKG79_16465 [Bryobacteraceae bacterium]|nr:hypothetical protein [Bryobacteraceae bacterium]